MLCGKCGAECAEETNFCVKCGEKIEQTDNTPMKKSKLPKKAKYAIAAAIAVVSIAAIRYFNSVEYLEKRLTGSTWHSQPHATTSYGARIYKASVYRFRSNGECERWFGQERLDGDGFVFYENNVRFWELLDDKSLKLAGAYYEYGEDWYFKDGNLVIDEWTYSDENKWGYSYDD